MIDKFGGQSRDPMQDVAGLFARNAPTAPSGNSMPMPTPAPRAPMPAFGSMAPLPQTLPQAPASIAPTSMPASAGPAVAPPGYVDVSGERLPLPSGNRAQQEFGMINPAPIEAYKAAGETDTPFQFAPGTFRSVHGNNYLIPGQPGYGAAAAAAPVAPPPLSDAQVMARQINEQAAKRRG